MAVSVQEYMKEWSNSQGMKMGARVKKKEWTSAQRKRKKGRTSRREKVEASAEGWRKKKRFKDEKK